MKLEIKGPIIPDGHQWIYDDIGIPATSAAKVNTDLNQAEGEDIEVFINSGGGSVFAGSEIYTTLKGYPGKVTIKIIGMAASAASVIAMAGDEIEMSPTGQLMIHNASVGAAGDKRDMIHTAEVLETVDRSISNAYELKTGKSQDELLELMNKETWLDSKAALKMGFIDKIMFAEEEAAFTNSAGIRADGTLSSEKIEAMQSKKLITNTKKTADQAKAKLKLEMAL